MKRFRGVKKSGFTLIELLVVIFIIGILATVVSMNVIGSQAKSRDARRKADINTLKTAFGQYYEDHGEYPDICGNPSATCDMISLPPALNPYLSVLPKDPKYKKMGDETYKYKKLDNPLAYAIFVKFETGNSAGECITGVNTGAFTGLPTACSF